MLRESSLLKHPTNPWLANRLRRTHDPQRRIHIRALLSGAHMPTLDFRSNDRNWRKAAEVGYRYSQKVGNSPVCKLQNMRLQV
jgi:hypothetical protein